MTAEEPEQVQELLATPDLASVLESRQFRRFLDCRPFDFHPGEAREAGLAFAAASVSQSSPERMITEYVVAVPCALEV